MKTMASFASSATTCDARKHAWPIFGDNLDTLSLAQISPGLFSTLFLHAGCRATIGDQNDVKYDIFISFLYFGFMENIFRQTKI